MLLGFFQVTKSIDKDLFFCRVYFLFFNLMNNSDQISKSQWKLYYSRENDNSLFINKEEANIILELGIPVKVPFITMLIISQQISSAMFNSFHFYKTCLINMQ